MGTNTNDASEVFERYAEGITEPEERERFTRYMEAWRAKQKVARPHDESVGELHKRIEVLEAARTADLENEGKLRMENAELRGRLRSVPSAGDAALLSVRANQIECLQKEVDRLHEELENMTKDKDELQAKLDASIPKEGIDMEKNDPLDELREFANGEKIGRIIDAWQVDRFIDAWQVDRSMSVALSDRVDELQAKLESVTTDRDEWRRTYKDVPPDAEEEMAKLQAKLDAAESDNSVLRTECTDLRGKLDASIWMPLDADGVKWTLTETEFIDENGCVQTGDFVVQNGKIYLSIPCKMGLHKLRECRHVAPKPETKLDIEIDICNHDFTDESDNVFCQSIETRAYECGFREGSAKHE